MTPFQILLTNDDGIDSPGLWAAAEALSALGQVTVAAPRCQESGTGRSMPSHSDLTIVPRLMRIGDRDWEVFAVGGTPAQVVQHAILEILPSRPDLVVSGINYGENFGSSITISGTIGAALEGAASGIPSLAVSLQLLQQEHFSNYAPLDFSAPAHFTRQFAAAILAGDLPVDVDILKVDVPAGATPATPWRITRLSRHRYYQAESNRRQRWEDPSSLVYHSRVTPADVTPDSDIAAVLFDGVVSVTPLSLDMTSRVDMMALENTFHARCEAADPHTKGFNAVRS
jgi:5'-nucleotidase